jgi:omega-6 fatty acid desaturase (delta-12 desaturase)
LTHATLDRPRARSNQWARRAAAFRASSWRPAALQLITTLVPLAALLVATGISVGFSPWLTLAFAPLTAGFLVRTFVIMHDCAHGSFTPSRRANEIIGVVTGIITLTPFAQWRRSHAIHHATSGDLDRRGYGDIDTITVAEYRALTPAGRFRYRLYRNGVVLFLLGPLYFLLKQRWQLAGDATAVKVSVHATNLALLALFGGLAWAFGAATVALVFFPAMYLATMAGIWLFYVQHQFEDAYWEPHGAWSYETAALHGSSYYRLPRVLEWFTASIGRHHVHHLDPKIPNYQLRRCHESVELFKEVPTLTLRTSWRTIRLKLWDEQQRRLVGFDAVDDAPSR